MKKKVLLCMATLAVLMMSMTACRGGSYTTVNSTEHAGKNYMGMSYSKFNGSKYETMKLSKGEELCLTSKVETKSGNLTIAVYDNEKNKIYSKKNPNATVEDTISIKKDGVYKLKVSGKHSGSFNVKWKVKK